MKQFKTIFRFEMKYYLKNRIFVGVTLFLVAAIALVMFFPRIRTALESEKTPGSPADRPVMLVAGGEETALLLFSSAFPGYEVKAAGADPALLREEVAAGNAECAFLLTGPASYTYYVANLSLYDQNGVIADELLKTLYQQNAMIGRGMTPEEAGEVMSVQIAGTIENLGADQAQNFWYTYIMIIGLYTVIMIYGQMVATNVANEKSNRAMELLITSTSPTGMMFGKVLASCLAGFLQLAAAFGSAILFYSLNRSYWGDNPVIASIFGMPSALFGYLLLFFVLGFLIYAFLYGAVGSTVSRLEDVNTAVMPITLLFVAGFMAVILSLASGSVDNTLMKICSFIPFTSPMAMFTRIAMSTVPWHEILSSVLILIASVGGIGFLAAKIYRVGVLLYGNTPKIGAVLRMLRKS
ncbi:MAG: ABC transporter permease [Clostridia bacterium]|nr:ABC transporter permease [Clostridia bacterium]